MTQEEVLMSEFDRMRLEIVRAPEMLEGVLATLVIEPDMQTRIVDNQRRDAKLEETRVKVRSESCDSFCKEVDNPLTFDGRLCGPKDAALRDEILSEGHDTPYTAHPGLEAMILVEWNEEGHNIVCRAMSSVPKSEGFYQQPYGKLQPLVIPECKCDYIAMDFVTGSPKSQRRNSSIWVIVDRLTRSAHFLPIIVTYGSSRLAKLYVSEIVRLHGVPKTIVSDRDLKFTSMFWISL